VLATAAEQTLAESIVSSFEIQKEKEKEKGRGSIEYPRLIWTERW
jgi:hypothetical protein